MNVRQAWIRRLRGRAGESIAEVLIALLISSLALMMLANMVGTSQKLVAGSKVSFSETVEKTNALTRADSGIAEEIRFTFRDDGVNYTRLGKNGDGENTDKVTVRIASAAVGRDTILSYRK